MKSKLVSVSLLNPKKFASAMFFSSLPQAHSGQLPCFASVYSTSLLKTQIQFTCLLIDMEKKNKKERELRI